MKIIRVDNFDRESVSDKLVCKNVNEYYAKRIVELLNEREHESSSDFYKAVPDDHVLFEFAIDL